MASRSEGDGRQASAARVTREHIDAFVTELLGNCAPATAHKPLPGPSNNRGSSSEDQLCACISDDIGVKVRQALVCIDHEDPNLRPLS
jgi:hypothetical protein